MMIIGRGAMWMILGHLLPVHLLPLPMLPVTLTDLCNAMVVRPFVRCSSPTKAA